MNPMKLIKLFARAACVVALGLAVQARAQTNFTTLHSFSAGVTNSDGAQPYAGLILSGSTLYGTTFASGSGNSGTVFSVGTNGTGFTTLHSFSAVVGGTFPDGTNQDGDRPVAGLLLSGGALYGTTAGGGPFGRGTVFKVSTSGTGFTTLHSFADDIDGHQPQGTLILSGGLLYGTTFYGGTTGFGTVFKISTNGTGFTTVFSFGANGTGGNPAAGVILSGNTLYGTTEFGSPPFDDGGPGYVYSVGTDGSGFVVLHQFLGPDGANPRDGGNPVSGLTLSGSTLYGTTQETVFKINTDGSNFTNLQTFSSTNVNTAQTITAGLVLSGSTLYGTLYTSGLASGGGAVFSIQTNGTGFTTLHNFSALGAGGTNSDGAQPYAGLVLSGSTLYGTTLYGGTGGNGTVFSLSTNVAPTPNTISINFSGTGGTGTNMATTELAGVVTHSHWNNAAGLSGSNIPLMDYTGTFNGAKLTFNDPKSYSSTTIANNAGNNRMMKFYLDSSASTTTTVSVSSLPANAAGYKVYVYFDGNNNETREGKYTISGTGITTTTINGFDNANTDFGGTFIQANNNAGNYVLFTIGNVSAFNLSATAVNNGAAFPRGPLNGIQIVPQ